MISLAHELFMSLSKKVGFKKNYYALSQDFYFLRCATQWYHKVDFRYGVELRASRGK